MKAIRRWAKDYSLGLVLVGLLLGAWAVQTVTGWVEYAAEQTAAGTTPSVFGRKGYVWVWVRATAENLQAGVLQLLIFTILAKYFLFRGSPQSRDWQDRMEGKLDEILNRLEQG